MKLICFTAFLLYNIPNRYQQEIWEALMALLTGRPKKMMLKKSGLTMPRRF